jgi:hypothetical protein
MKAIIRKMNLSFLTYLEIDPVILSEVAARFFPRPPWGRAATQSKNLTLFA